MLDLSPADKFQRALVVLDYVASGKTLSKSCDWAGLSVTQFLTLKKNNKELAAAFEEAVQQGNDRMAEALVNIETDLEYGTNNPAMASVVSRNIQWYLSRRDARYADKTINQVVVTADKAIVDALQSARERATRTALTSPVVEVVALEVVEEAVQVAVDLDDDLLQFL